MKTHRNLKTGINLLAVLISLFVIFNQKILAEELDRIVAVVDDDVVMESELERGIERVRREAAQRGVKLPPRDILEKQVLERLIMNKIQLHMAEQAGIKVDDTMLNHALGNIAQENGMTLEKFRETIEKEGYDFNLFREDIRNEITLTRLRQERIDNRIFVTDQEIKNYLATQSQQGNNVEEYRLQHILIAMPEDADEKQKKKIKQKAEKVLEQLRSGEDFTTVAREVSDAGNASEGGDLGWLKAEEIPSLFTSILPELDKGEISDLLKNDSGYHIIKLVDKRSSDIQMIPQTHARHILIRTSELVSDDEARRKLEQLKDRIEEGEDFAELAKAYSEDKASAVKGGDLGWINPGDMIPDFEKEMDSLSTGEISEPFKTRFGWHIVQVLGRRQYDGTEELTIAKARAAIKKRKAKEEEQSWLMRLRNEAYVEYRL